MHYRSIVGWLSVVIAVLGIGFSWLIGGENDRSFSGISGLYRSEHATAHQAEAAMEGDGAAPTAAVLEDAHRAAIPEATVDSARAMLNRYFGSWEAFRDLSAADLAKRLTFIAHNHCDSLTPHTGAQDINDLFVDCRTSCFGFSYVLRGLLAVYGIESRYLNFYNMPNQGNHTAVEAKLTADGWSFFDPTFGVFFTRSGENGSHPVSADELRAGASQDRLMHDVHQARKASVADAKQPLDQLIKERVFSAEYMTLENYILADNILPADDSLLLPLLITLDVSSGSVKFGVTAEAFKARPEAEQEFLRVTNETLLDGDADNDVSFRFSYLGKVPASYESLQAIYLRGMERDKKYVLNLIGFSDLDTARVQLTELGGAVSLGRSDGLEVPRGNFTLAFPFTARKGEGLLLVSRRDEIPTPIRIVGLAVKAAVSTLAPPDYPQLR